MDYDTGISKIMSCYKGLHVQSKFENVEGAFRVILTNTWGGNYTCGKSDQ